MIRYIGIDDWYIVSDVCAALVTNLNIGCLPLGSFLTNQEANWGGFS